MNKVELDGNLPRFLRGKNRFGAPGAILIFQGVIVSIMSSIFILMPTINSSYWLLTTISAQLYMVMYILMFIAAIRLRYKYPKIKRPFTISGGKAGIWFIAALGASICLFTIVIGFYPPQGIEIYNLFQYEALITFGLVFFSLVPFIVNAISKSNSQEIENSKNSTLLESKVFT